MTSRIETVTRELLQAAGDAKVQFGALTVEQLNWKPAGNSWSVSQCLDHVIRAHSLYFPLFERAAAGDEKPSLWARISPFSGFCGRFLIRSLDPANTKKMKTEKKAYPSASEIDAGIVGRYIEHQRQMIDHLQKMPAEIDAANTIITSPLLSVVTYSLDDAFTILRVHTRRHFDQARRVIEMDGFPRSDKGE